MTRGWASVCAVLLGLSGCSRVDLAAERAAILATDRPWQEAIAAKDVEKSLSFWAEDAVVMPPAQRAVVGKDAIRRFVTESFRIPGFGIRWETTGVAVSPHAEMAYAFGRTTTTLTGPDGKPMTLPAKSLTVWRKGPDGAWKCVVDAWSDDAPPAPKL
ncbi:MAG TPA: DUF4440 domain-containing protein [Myxococcaceae bacterium]|nr:DUF4440 domain-containing protein [Myxococcaceae bacterium]